MSFEKYNRLWPDDTHKAVLELRCFRDSVGPDTGGVGRAQHLANAMSYLWPKRFIWHKWAKQMIIEMAQEQYVSIAGPGSSGKTAVVGRYALTKWWSSPHNSTVVLASTSIEKAKKLIFSEVMQGYNTATVRLTGKALGNMLRYDPPDGSRPDDKNSIFVIATDRAQASSSIEKLQGLKNKYVTLIVDEAARASDVVIDAIENLSRNQTSGKESFQVIFMANPEDILDPHGILSTPKVGWENISVEDERWETEFTTKAGITRNGVCLHFDALKSENYLTPFNEEEPYPFLIRRGDIDAAIKKGDANDMLFWSQYRGFWPPASANTGIYSGLEIIKHLGNKAADFNEKSKTVLVAGADPAFTCGGDRFILNISRVGTLEDRTVIEHLESIAIKADMTNKEIPPNYQRALEVIRICKERGILPEHLGVDMTGENPIYDIIVKNWPSTQILKCPFGGKPSDLPISEIERQPASERFADKVSELWFVGQHWLRNEQIRGLERSLIRQMTVRKYDLVGGKVRIESKKALKERTKGESPDEADAFMISLFVARSRLGGRAGAGSFQNVKRKWGEIRSKYDCRVEIS
jgi:hypothetical protein